MVNGDPFRCPWCENNKNIGFFFEERMNNIHIVCICGISGPYHSSESEAINSWNKMVKCLKSGMDESTKSFW